MTEMSINLQVVTYVATLVVAVSGAVGIGWGLARKAARDELADEGSQGHKAVRAVAEKVVALHRETCPVESRLSAVIEQERDERREGRAELKEAINASEGRTTAAIVQVQTAVTTLSGRIDMLLRNGGHA